MSDLVGVDQTRKVWRGGVVGMLLDDSLPCLATVMSQINRCDDLFPSLLLFGIYQSCGNMGSVGRMSVFG